MYARGVATELTTPTGALLVTGFAESYGLLPELRVEAIGYGAGDKDFPEQPNLLRMLIGESAAVRALETIVSIECEIDDMNPQLFGPLMDRLYAAGALDVYYAAVQMKKNRPGTLVTVIAAPDRREALSGILFTDTTTIGVRHREMLRERLDRAIRTIETPVGAIRFKVASRDGRIAECVPGVRGLRQGRGRARARDQGSAGAGHQGMDGQRELMPSFYITTPIYYINAEPHLGHAYTSMVADAIARSRRLLEYDVFFLTGTDEHGQKVERAAQAAGVETKAFADRVAAKFRALTDLLNLSNDDFIRTTEERHKRAAQAIWQRVADRGYLYKASYEGWYCTVDELFVPETQLVDGRRCPTCGNAVERLSEESYFFRLSQFTEPLLEHYRANPGVRLAGDPAQRDDGVRRRRPARPERQPHLVQVGHSRPRRSRARHVRVVRCADQLPDRGRLSG